MKTLYRIIKTIASKSTSSLFQNQKVKLNMVKGGLKTEELNSLLSQMYSAENENLFI